MAKVPLLGDAITINETRRNKMVRGYCYRHRYGFVDGAPDEALWGGPASTTWGDAPPAEMEQFFIDSITEIRDADAEGNPLHKSTLWILFENARKQEKHRVVDAEEEVGDE